MTTDWHQAGITAYRWPQRLSLALLALRECLWLYGALLIGRAQLDVPAVARALRQSGLSILPALTLMGLAAGLLMGNRTQTILIWLDFPSLVLPTVIDAITRELVPILVGVLVSSRAGVALAVRQATLVVTGERDALLTLGLDPIRFTTGPALLAMLVMSFAAAVWGNLTVLSATAFWLWQQEGVSVVLFWEVLTHTLSPALVAEGVFKPMLFALLIALVATVNGFTAPRQPQGIDQAATHTMIGAVTAIVLADTLLTLLLV